MIEGLQGTITDITVTVSRKLSDNNYGSGEASLSIGESIADATVDVEAEFNKLYAWAAKECAAKVVELVGHNTPSTKPVVESKQPQSLTQDNKTVVTQHTGMLESTSKTFPVDTITVDVKSGKKYVKAKGGSFVQYGVNVWPEVLALPPLEWDVEELAPTEIPAPAGLTAIYSEKEITTKDGDKKLVPDKVTGWA